MAVNEREHAKRQNYLLNQSDNIKLETIKAHKVDKKFA